MNRKCRILVVEDDTSVLLLLSDILSTNDYEVITASNGEEALDKLQDVTPDAIISDVMMPKMNGFELVKKLQKNERTRGIPFLFLSAKSEFHDLVEGLAIGADDYICKPFAIGEFLARVRSNLQKKETQTQRKNRKGVLNGDLSVMPIVELIQLLKFEKKTGEIVLAFEDEQASIRMNRGEVVDIHFRQSEGLPAFRDIIQHNEGWFTFRLSEQLYEVKMHIDTQELIFKAVKQIDEYWHSVSQLPPLHHIYVIADMENTAPLPDDTEQILFSFDGQHSLETVLDNSPLEKSKTVDIIQFLIDYSYIQPIFAPVQTSVFQKLGHAQRFAFIKILQTQPTTPSLVLLKLGDVDLGNILDILCGPLQQENVTQDKSPMKNIQFRQVFLDVNMQINVYGLQNHQQFPFLWHILDQRVFGLFILVDDPQCLKDPQTRDFYFSLQGEFHLPYVTVLTGDKHSGDQVNVISQSDTIQQGKLLTCSGIDIDSLTQIFWQWQEIATVFYGDSVQ